MCVCLCIYICIRLEYACTRIYICACMCIVCVYMCEYIHISHPGMGMLTFKLLIFTECFKKCFSVYVNQSKFTTQSF